MFLQKGSHPPKENSRVLCGPSGRLPQVEQLILNWPHHVRRQRGPTSADYLHQQSSLAGHLRQMPLNGGLVHHETQSVGGGTLKVVGLINYQVAVIWQDLVAGNNVRQEHRMVDDDEIGHLG